MPKRQLVLVTEEKSDFEEFWKMWPRKCSKKRARTVWERLSREERVKAFEALPGHVEYYRKSGTEIGYIPHLGTWLNQERWDDELPMDDAWKNKFLKGDESE